MPNDESKQDEKKSIAHPWQGPAVKVDLSSWTTMEPIMAWQDAARTSDFRKMSEMMTGVVVQWPHDVPPGDVASYGKIPPAAWKATAQKVGEAVGSFFQDATA